MRDPSIKRFLEGDPQLQALDRLAMILLGLIVVLCVLLPVLALLLPVFPAGSQLPLRTPHCVVGCC